MLPLSQEGHNTLGALAPTDRIAERDTKRFSCSYRAARGAKLSGHRHGDAELRDFLARAGLAGDAHQRPLKGYSKGMRQKVGVAIALAKRAEALLLDEPTSGLDPKASNEFSQLIVTLARNGAAILMATHDLFRAKESGTRVGIMREGMLRTERAACDLSHSELEAIYLEHMQDHD